jgi:pimeloyl-ACP methyl ester carboxylesterase
MEPHKIWKDQCEAAQGIEDEFGTQQALEYLVGEKFLNFLEAAETDANFRAEIPAFVAKIKEIFEPWQLAQYLETARETEPFDPSLFDYLEMGADQDAIFRDLTLPVALILGERSEDEGALEAEAMAAMRNGGMPVVSIPETHHHLMFEEPMALVASISSIVQTWHQFQE